MNTVTLRSLERLTVRETPAGNEASDPDQRSDGTFRAIEAVVPLATVARFAPKSS